MTDFYEPDPHHSPLLQPVIINTKPSESPPPFLPEDLSSSSDEEDIDPGDSRARAGRVSRKVRPSQGDAVLLGELAPNHPDIAQRAAEISLAPDISSETESIRGDMGDVNDTSDPQAAAVNIAGEALKFAEIELKHEPTNPPSGSQRAPNESKSPAETNSQKHVKTERPSQLRRLSPKPRQQPIPIQTEPNSIKREDNDSIATSPNLAKYTIVPSEPVASTLPALQTSPGRSNSAFSPDNSQTLPPLKTALRDQLEGTTFSSLSATSPPTGRSHAPYFAPHSGPSPGAYSHPSPASMKDVQNMSPPSALPTHPGYWRTAPKSETSTSSAVSDVTTPSTLSHSPHSSYQAPIAQAVKAAGEADASNLPNGPLPANGPLTSSTFKCTYPGCTALPFQTQYLLNSHANVHSQNRPHYCPVPGCPRSAGGKGFKRKNEMIRHGLVHDSPGYMCPFCPDQQHKYPRPDNLQRHVRVHHVDKDKEDPLLREVLAQRPDGPNRRRRRLGS